MYSALLIIVFLLLLCYAVLLIYYRYGWKSIPEFVSDINSTENNSTYISIIVPARNEEKNIVALLNAINQQTYPSHLFEVIIVDDHSTDNTANLVSSFNSTNIRLIYLSDYINNESLNAYKKKAIEIGINESRGTLIVTTDADCTMNKNWLKTIADCYERNHPKMIVMPVSIKNNFRFIEMFQSLDFICLQGITGAAVYKKMHGMCNGANLAYTKAVFEEAGGFKGIDDIASGDDLLLMHKIAKLYPNEIIYLKSDDVIVETAPVKTINEFFNQRIRWASKADKYEDKRLFPVLLLVYLLNLSLLLLFIEGVFSDFKIHFSSFSFSILQFFVFILFIKIIFEIYFLYPVVVFFKKQKLLLLFPLMQPFHIIYTVVAGWLGKFGNYTWKDRKVK